MTEALGWILTALASVLGLGWLGVKARRQRRKVQSLQQQHEYILEESDRIVDESAVLLKAAVASQRQARANEARRTLGREPTKAEVQDLIDASKE